MYSEDSGSIGGKVEMNAHGDYADGSRMRIVFLCDQYPPVVWDGAGTYTHAAAHALAELGHDVHVVACEGRRWSDTVDGGVSVHRRPALTIPVTKLLGPFRRLVIGAHSPRDSLSIRASLAASYALWMRLLHLRPDVVETQDGETRGLFFALRHSVPLVIYLHTPTMLDVWLMGRPLSWRGRLADRIDRLSSDRADVLTSPSQLLVDTLRRFGWLEGEVPEIIPPGACGAMGRGFFGSAHRSRRVGGRAPGVEKGRGRDCRGTPETRRDRRRGGSVRRCFLRTGGRSALPGMAQRPSRRSRSALQVPGPGTARRHGRPLRP